MQSPLLRTHHPDAPPGPEALLSPEARRIMAAALESAHANESADGFAHRIGLRNRHQLNRLLHQHHLPTYRVIAAVARLAGLHEAARQAHRSLCSEMMVEGVDPAWAYRAVRRLSGKSWKELRHLSTVEFINTLIRARVIAIRERSAPVAVSRAS